jgi:hypothetical protein
MASVSILRRTGLAVLVAGLVLSCAVADSDLAFGQAPATGNAQSGKNAAPGAKPAKNTHPHSKKSKVTKAAVEPAPVEVRPADPPPPDWPVNDKAKPASVAWNGRDLSITATNSSLGQILHDVSTATGLKVEGLSGSQSGQGEQHDQRIYGSYGPASERDVLSQLLEGSGYNVIMVGDQGEGAPRELVLTAQAAGGKGVAPHAAQTNQASEEDTPEEPEPPPDPQLEQPHRPLNGQPGQPPQGGRTPQQMLQEIQQRQQQMQQQQQQQGNQTTPNE